MMHKWLRWCGVMMCWMCFAVPAIAQTRQLPQAQLKSGLAFAGADVRALQADEFGNPAQLWLARGAQRWREPQGAAGQSCQSCHDVDG